MAWQDYADEIRGWVRTGAPISVTQLFYSLVMRQPWPSVATSAKRSLTRPAGHLNLPAERGQFRQCGWRWASCAVPGAQHHGRQHSHARVGIFVQLRAARPACLPAAGPSSAGLWPAISANLLIATGQDPAIAVNTEMYFLLLSPGCLGIIAFRALVAYTDTLGRLWPTLLVHVIGFLVNLLLQYVLVLHTDLGLAGSAIALPSSSGGCGCTRTPGRAWSPRAFLGWGKFFGGMLPAIGTQTLWIFGTERWQFSSRTAGQVGDRGESLLFQINFLAFLLPWGWAVPSSPGWSLPQRNRSRRRGQADPPAPALLFMSVTGLRTLLVGGIFMALRFQIPKLYSLDAEVHQPVREPYAYLAVYTTLQLIAYPCVATLRACNHHW
uniref:Integral membrane protein n=1 Tax=Macrostomum lignano TaxID=282301 RepID=A0A1I8FMK5_9PLAT